MGRIATTAIAITLVLGAVPTSEIRLLGMLNAASAALVQEEESQSGSESAAQPESAPAATSEGSSTAPASESSASAAPPSPASLPNSSGVNSSSTNGAGSPATATSGSGGDGNDGLNQDASATGTSLGPGTGNVSIQVDTPAVAGDEARKTPSFFDLESFLASPMNLILLLFLGFYAFLLLVPKPGQKERKQLQQRLASLKKNDRVVLSSGIHGVVANVNAEAGTVTVRVDESSNARLTVDRSAIRSVEA